MWPKHLNRPQADQHTRAPTAPGTITHPGGSQSDPLTDIAADTAGFNGDR